MRGVFTVSMGALALALGLTAPAGPAQAETDSGAYLAARAAAEAQDYKAAARFYAQALGRDPENPILLDALVLARIGMGDFEGATSAADRLVDRGTASQMAHLVRQVDAARAGAWETVLDRVAAGETVGPLVDGLARAWALVGAGRMTDALAAFDDVIDSRGLRAFGLYHKALALAVAGDLEGADAILSLPPAEGMQRTRRSTIAHAEILGRLGRRADATALIDRVFGADPDPAIADLRARLADGAPITGSIAPSPADGLAEAYVSVAGALDGETADSYTLIYARASLALRPGDADTVLLTAGLLERMGRHDMAEATYRRIDRDHPAYPTAEIGRAEVLEGAGRIDAAREVLTALARARPEDPRVHLQLGNVLRRTKLYAEAEEAYASALRHLAGDDPMLWLTHYLRGISRHRQDAWPGAESDFRTALALQPGQPEVLNYLGYSLVERRENLDEALSMIENAVAQRPDNGAIVDSLGWVQFRLGDFDAAVRNLERAAALEPMESVINDHLGDALWAVGRVIEARFQWHRALSLDPEDAEAERIRLKLDIGLDAVLAREGEPPLVRIAHEDG